MRIEKIELIGFKSFADRTTFTLHQGITGIVGPNGCGKSNIVDAFRWVLGEQSAKSLRGDKMEEVIFNGSSTKKPKGMAEVAMVISGLNGASGNGSAHGDLITISRRLYRSGESEYMINKNSCRLKDIRDIFLDTGLDFRSYSILEQGRIGEIINSKPLDRRFIIEEVAGVMKYKVRKAEALSKLDSSRANLVRINDVITEVKKQINILDRLAKKAERYQKLAAEMRAIELKLTRREYHSIHELHTAVLEEYAVLKEKDAALSSEISESENRTESRRVALLEREKALEVIQKEFQTYERDISETERTVAVGKNDIANLGEYQTKIKSQQAEIAGRKEELSSRIRELGEAQEQVAGELEAHADVLRDKAETFREAEESLAEKEELLDEKRREIFRISEQLSAARNELGRHHTTHEALERKEALAQKESEETRKTLAATESAIAGVETDIHGRNNEILFHQEKKQVLVQELAAAKARNDEGLRNLAEAREELASSSSRLASLKEIVFDTPTREMIVSEGTAKLLASLSEVTEVSAEYEKAIENALSEKADTLILESEDEIKKVAAALRDREIAKTALSALGMAASESRGDVPLGAIGSALDYVKISQGYETVVRSLLGNILLVDSLETALRMREGNAGFVYVTRDGEVLDTGGAVIIGAGKGIFRRRREIRELEESVTVTRERIERLSEESQRLQSEITEKEEAIRSTESALHTLEKEISLSRLTIQNFTEEKERLSRKIAYLSLEMEEAAREKTSIDAAVVETEQKVREVESLKTQSEDENAILQDEIARTKSEIEEHRSEVTELRLLVTSKKEKLEAMRNEAENAGRNLEQLDQRRADLEAESESVLQRVAARETEILEHETRLRKLVAEADTLRASISEKREGIDRENEELMTVEQGLKALRQEVSTLRARIAQLEVERAEHRMRLENLAESVRQNYGLDVAEVELLEVTPEEETRLGELRAKIQEIGPVNLGTLDEYEELRTRFEFLSKQHEDLTKSIAELEEAISKINTTTRKRLRDAFEILNTKFREIFTTLFGGGKAELVLTDESNILESGLDIVAQPPGKKLQNLHLLSGGEKALTALSIQFASFLIKPTPLCILDEADAPLDESNTDRYSRMLQNLSENTQFIVVTHNRTTMGVAQHLYGITMEEAGVSKVISMQLSEVSPA